MEEVFELGYKPLRDEVVLLLPHISNKTKDGIIKSDSLINQEREDLKNSFLQVLAVGSTVQHVKIGDEVKVKGFYAVWLDGVEYGQCLEYQISGLKVK